MQDEILKHTRKIHSDMKSPMHSFGKKLREIIIEIFIIFFAVTLSIWLHNWSEHRHQQKEAKEFLLGLRGDLRATINDCKDAIEDYKECGERYTYLSSLKSSVKPDTNSLKKYFAEYGDCPIFHFNASRYKGFISSGKIELIENKTLLKHILDLYQQDLPTYEGMVNGWDDHRDDLRALVINNLIEKDDGTDNRF
jgi:hypothetical protein